MYSFYGLRSEILDFKCSFGYFMALKNIVPKNREKFPARADNVKG